ncbi:MAG TPA: hypothetical protein VFS40_14050 [Gemmatimonadales bacterium]|nr:hypothetical protein [Gemmatimonadales bacterium]
MNDERLDISPPELARWLAVAAVILAGAGLYLWLAPRTAPLAPPAELHEVTP